jgi:hypothetical protein
MQMAVVEHRTPGPTRKQSKDVSLVFDAHCFSWLSIDPVCIIQQTLVATHVALSKESSKRTLNIWNLPATELACHLVLSSLAQELATLH